jgi:hypothetical protein
VENVPLGRANAIWYIAQDEMDAGRFQISNSGDAIGGYNRIYFIL